MSFMKGFGAAFSDNFDREQRVKAQERDDQFKMTYQEFIKKTEARREQEKSDTRLANQAKALIEGVDGVPPEAYGKVYNWLQSGLDDQEIARRLQTGKFEVKQKAGEKEVQETPSAKPVDQQMAGGGLGAEPKMPQEDQGLLGKIGLGNLFGNQREKNQNIAYERIASATEMTPDAVRDTTGSSISPKVIDDSNVSFTPGAPARKPDEFANGNEAAIELAQARTSGDPKRLFIAQQRMDAIKAYETQQFRAKADAERGGLGGFPATIWRDGKYATNAIVKVVPGPDGTDQYVDAASGEPIDGKPREITEWEDKIIKEAASDLQKPLQNLNSRASNIQGAVQSYAIMSDLVKKSDGAVLAGWTSAAARGASQAVTELGQAAKQINDAAGGGQELPIDGVSYLQELQDKVLAEGGNDLATQSSLFELQKAMLAYRLASSMGQDGRSLAETERKLFTEMASGGVTPDRFYKGMSDLLVPAAKNIDNEGERLVRTNTAIRRLDYVPKELEYIPVQLDLEGSKDPDISNAWKELSSQAGIKSTFPMIPTVPNPAAQAPVNITNDAAGKAAYDSLPPGASYVAPDGTTRTKPKRVE